MSKGPTENKTVFQLRILKTLSNCSACLISYCLCRFYRLLFQSSSKFVGIIKKWISFDMFDFAYFAKRLITWLQSQMASTIVTLVTNNRRFMGAGLFCLLRSFILLILPLELFSGSDFYGVKRGLGKAP